jgi:ubiquitin-protein ligase
LNITRENNWSTSWDVKGILLGIEVVLLSKEEDVETTLIELVSLDAKELD